MSSQLEPTQTTPFDDAFFQHSLPQYYRATLQQFKKVMQGFMYLHTIFSLTLLLEIGLFLPLVQKPALFAFALGFFFLTAFSYCIFLFYFQAKKPEQLLFIRSQFLESCRHLLPSGEGRAEHHLSLAAALLKLSSYLEEFEDNEPKAFSWVQPLIKTLEKLFRTSRQKTVLFMQELLFESAIHEHLLQLRSTPTDLEVHASLANAYVDLSQLYEPTEKPFKKAVKLALEEFKILTYYTPDDPWVHEQLADGYAAMNMPLEETKQLERLVQLLPQNPDILLRLGQLYFAQGENAQGLKTFESLKALNYKKAEELISLYGV